MTGRLARIAFTANALCIGGCMGSSDAINHPPTMESVRVYGNEDVATRFTMVAYDEDRDDLELMNFSATRGDLAVEYVSHTLLPEATRLKMALVFDPTPNYHGDAVIRVRLSDGVDSVSVVHPVVIASINDGPTATHDTLAASVNMPAVIFPSTLIANDFDRDQYDLDYVPSLAVTGVSSAEHGTVILGTDTIMFTPESNFSGIASFKYTLSDGQLTDTAGVGIAVGMPNAAPKADDDWLEITPDTSSKFVFAPPALTRNDIDSDGQSLAVIAVFNAIHGSVEVNTGVVTFTLGPDFDGTASFDYTVTDGVATDSAHVTLGVPEPI
jgi:hypothetical protein